MVVVGNTVQRSCVKGSGRAGDRVDSGGVTRDAVVIGLAVQLIAVLEKLLLAREASRRDAVAWKGAVELSKAGGDGAAVARALRKTKR